MKQRKALLCFMSLEREGGSEGGGEREGRTKTKCERERGRKGRRQAQSRKD